MWVFTAIQIKNIITK